MKMHMVFINMAISDLQELHFRDDSKYLHRREGARALDTLEDHPTLTLATNWVSDQYTESSWWTSQVGTLH